MAYSLQLKSGSLFIGSPIMVQVVSGTPGNVTFHRVKLIVKAALSTDGKIETFELSSPCGNAEVVMFDISTALRSLAAKYDYTLVTSATTYPYIQYSLEAYDEWMRNGILTEKDGVYILPADNSKKLYALMGAFTARERYLSSDDTRDVTAFTRKPLTGEICAPGELLVYPSANITPLKITDTLTSGPSASVATLDGSGVKTYGGRTIYVDSNAKNRMLFQFVNGYGVMETISAEMLEEVGSRGATEVDEVTAPSSFGKPHSSVARRDERKAVYKCSSGYINKEWSEWWATEFLGGDKWRKGGRCKCWVLLDGNWLPCTVVPDDDITLYDRSKPGLIHVDFEVRVL